MSSNNEGTRLDSHANMVVCGKYCHILSRSRINAMVSAFTDDVGTMQIPIIDAVILYDCLDTTKVWLLIVRNVLSVESMNHNLIPLFILREGDMEVNDRPKIHHLQEAVLIDDDDFMEDEWNQKYDPLADIKLLTVMYLDVIFTGPSVMYNKEAEVASAMAENGLLTNTITEIDEAPWTGALVGEDRDWDLSANVNSFATECHLLQVSSLFKSLLGSMTRRASQPRKNSCPLFTTNPSIIDLGLNLDGNVSVSEYCTRGVTLDNLSKLWRIDIEAVKKTLEITTQLRKHKVDGPLTRNFSTNNRIL